ncbi:MAG: T9SS type A sorting domain-containing protein [Chitinivibrionales bacterium]|nr:T9SS type A sorting domain-containing protein [Chitinivibrionales bacterium]
MFAPNGFTAKTKPWEKTIVIAMFCAVGLFTLGSQANTTYVAITTASNGPKFTPDSVHIHVGDYVTWTKQPSASYSLQTLKAGNPPCTQQDVATGSSIELIPNTICSWGSLEMGPNSNTYTAYFTIVANYIYIDHRSGCNWGYVFVSAASSVLPSAAGNSKSVNTLNFALGKDALTVTVDFKGPSQLEIVNLNGAVVMRFNAAHESTYRIDRKSLAAGLYMLRATDANGVKAAKLLTWY